MSKPYNIFISWSGPRSHAAADALRDWLPTVLQSARPWMSDSDIEKGSRSLREITGALEGMKVAIVCLTPENLASGWILYEAGALSKTIDDKTRLCTYLLGGLKAQHVKPPLGMFQSTDANETDTRKLIRTVNSAISEDPVAEPYLDRSFSKLWPDLEEKLRNLPTPGDTVEPKRPMEDVVAEILEIARAGVNRRKSLEWIDQYEPALRDFLPLFAEILPALGEAVRLARSAKAHVAQPPPTPLPDPPGPLRSPTE